MPARRLDDFSLPAIGFVKIEVEGHEEAVLQGGENLLRRDRPAYMIEIEERHSPNDFVRIVQCFERFNYTTTSYDSFAFRDISRFDERKYQGVTSYDYTNNFLSFFGNVMTPFCSIHDDRPFRKMIYRKAIRMAPRGPWGRQTTLQERSQAMAA